MTRAVRTGLALAAVALVASSAPAAAQLDDGARYLSDADFERAERAFSRALAGHELSTADLVAIFEGRAMARWALGDEEAARGDLAALASLDPDHALSPEAPPPLVQAFARVPHEALTLEPSWDDETPGTSRLRMVVRGDVAELVRVVRVHARRRGEPWSESDEPTIDIARREGEVVEVWAEALGPGGAVVARAGTALAPLEHGGPLDAGVRDALAAPTREPDATPIWIGVGVGAAVLVALVIGIGVGVGTAQSDVTQPRAPVVIGF